MKSKYIIIVLLVILWIFIGLGIYLVKTNNIHYKNGLGDPLSDDFDSSFQYASNLSKLEKILV